MLKNYHQILLCIPSLYDKKIKSSEGKVELKKGTNSLIISFENLISIVNKWCSLLKHNVPYIILHLKGNIYSDDIYSLKGANTLNE